MFAVGVGWRSVLQILRRWIPVARYLAALTLPDKIRHGKLTQIQVAVSVILGDRGDMSHEGLHNA